MPEAQVPFHFHCHNVMEASTDRNLWQEPTNKTLSRVAWTSDEVLSWIYDQLLEHYDQVEDAYGRRAWYESYLDSYKDQEHLHADLWPRLKHSLDSGHQSISTHHLRFRSILVLYRIPRVNSECRH